MWKKHCFVDGVPKETMGFPHLFDEDLLIKPAIFLCNVESHQNGENIALIHRSMGVNTMKIITEITC